MSNRPRYTFDKCNPVVDSIAGEMEQKEFGIKVSPAGGESSQDTAKILNGLIRNIQSMSGAIHTFNSAGRKMVMAGFDAWRVTQEWGDSFDQDLYIRKISNAVDRVWFDTGAELQDMSDANHAFVLQALTIDEYEKKFPKGSKQSVGDSKTEQVYSYKPKIIVVGEILYKKSFNKEIVLMSNNKVYDVDDKYESVAEELKADGITESRRRTVKSHKVMSRLFDGTTFLSDAKETVFDFIPVVPVYGNFDISEDKVVYRGAINKLKDSQRVLNYAQSREIEEGALAPRGKYWMTREQAEKDKAKLQTLNTNSDPVQTYTHIDGVLPPYWQGGAQINAGLQLTSASMNQNIMESSGIFAANQGNAPDQSGYAIELQQDKGDTSTIKYFTSKQIAVEHTARIIINAIPKIYDTKRTVRILGEDDSSKMETINDQVWDNETQKNVSLNDLRKGKYDVTCDIGEAFKNRQQETDRAFIAISAIDPSIIGQGKDIWLNNLSAPGMDLMAERARKQLLEAGQIPDSQMTDEEKTRAQAIIDNAKQNPPQPTAMDQALIGQTEANTADIQSKMQERADKSILAAEKLRLEENKQNMAMQQQMFDQQKAIIEALNTQADTLNKLREGMTTEKGAENYEDQTEIIGETQDRIESPDDVSR